MKEELVKDFIKFIKRNYNVDFTVRESNDGETFEDIYGYAFEKNFATESNSLIEKEE